MMLFRNKSSQTQTETAENYRKQLSLFKASMEPDIWTQKPKPDVLHMFGVYYSKGTLFGGAGFVIREPRTTRQRLPTGLPRIMAESQGL